MVFNKARCAAWPRLTSAEVSSEDQRPAVTDPPSSAASSPAGDSPRYRHDHRRGSPALCSRRCAAPGAHLCTHRRSVRQGAGRGRSRVRPPTSISGLHQGAPVGARLELLLLLIIPSSSFSAHPFFLYSCSPE